MSQAMNLIPAAFSAKVGVFSIDNSINNFRGVKLLDVLRRNTNTTFLPNATKYCYQMDYKTLTCSVRVARDEFTQAINNHNDGYVRQEMHSLSGEQMDLCLYTYGPEELRQFLENNKGNHYTYLPLTVHATESANGYRHDMLIIFNNKTKMFYWFDGGNRSDYLPNCNNIPKNAVDILLINLAETVKLGYLYEPSLSWIIQGVCQPLASVGQLDFTLSSAWCYLVASILDNYDSPTEMLSVLDTLSKENLFHLLYTSMTHMIGANYNNTLAQNVQVNMYDEHIQPATRHTSVPSTVQQSASPPEGTILPGVLTDPTHAVYPTRPVQVTNNHSAESQTTVDFTPVTRNESDVSNLSEFAGTKLLKRDTQSDSKLDKCVCFCNSSGQDPNKSQEPLLWGLGKKPEDMSQQELTEKAAAVRKLLTESMDRLNSTTDRYPDIMEKYSKLFAPAVADLQECLDIINTKDYEPIAYIHISERVVKSVEKIIATILQQVNE